MKSMINKEINFDLNLVHFIHLFGDEVGIE